MVVLVWCGCVRAVVLGRAARLGCCGTVAVESAGEGGTGGVPRGSGTGVVRRGRASVLAVGRALLAGALAGPLTCLCLLRQVGVGGG